MNPVGLRNKPDLPWYYRDFLRHFNCLSKSRSRDNGTPNPIDILTILKYNKEIAKFNNPDLLLVVIQELDMMYVEKCRTTN